MLPNELTHDRDSLFEQILENPIDLEARRIYADCLAEHGDPRGEFILRQFEVEESDPWSPAFVDAKLEADRLLQQNDGQWDSDFWEFVTQEFPPDEEYFRSRSVDPKVTNKIGFHYRYGFVDNFEFRQAREFRKLDILVSLVPLRKLVLGVGVDDKSTSLLASFRHIDVTTTTSDFLSSLDMQELESFKFRAPTMGTDKILTAIRKTPFANLRSLDLSCNKITSIGLERLAVAGCFENLEHLRLTDNPLGNGAANTLAKGGALGSLQSLNIKLTNIGDLGFKNLAEKGTPALKKLAIGWWFGTNPTAKGIRRLLDSGCLSNLTELDLTGWEMPPDVVQAIAFAPELANLKILRLGNTRIDDRSTELLASSKHLRQLDLLDLTASKISLRGLQTLLESDAADGLTSLNLSGVNSLAESDLKNIFELPTLSSLRYLDLSRKSLSPMGLKTISKSESLCDLQALDLTDNEFEDRDIFDLSANNSLESVCQVRINTKQLSEKSVDVLKNKFSVFTTPGRLDRY
ncbi:MAG: TIGR02996 domain-containing protein [Mariniblastus sp.]